MQIDLIGGFNARMMQTNVRTTHQAEGLDA
jgi:hypothetical protein